MNQLVTLKRGMISAIMLFCAATGFAQTSVVTHYQSREEQPSGRGYCSKQQLS